MQSISFFAICLLAGVAAAVRSVDENATVPMTTMTNAVSETAPTNAATPKSDEHANNDDPNVADGTGRPTRIPSHQPETTIKSIPLNHDSKTHGADPKTEGTSPKAVTPTTASNTNTHGIKDSTTTPASGKTNGNNAVSRVNAGCAVFIVVALLTSGIVS